VRQILNVFSTLDTTLQQKIATKQLKGITSTRQAARSLNCPHKSLETVAKQLCQQQGVNVASAITAHRSLCLTVRKILKSADVVGTAQLWAPALKAVLRSGITPETLAKVGSERIQPLTELVSEYQAQLKFLGLIDSTEVLWKAAQLQPEHQAICIYGYFQPRLDELAFLNALADDESVLFLPCGESSEFTNNQQAISWLEEHGWTSNHILPEPKTSGEQLQVRFLDQTAPLPAEVQCQTYVNLEAEVRGVLAQVKQLMKRGVVANEVLLVARDDAFYGPMVLDIAWEYQIPVRALYDVPIHETRLGAWVKLLLEVIQSDFPFEATAKLLSHPLAIALPDEIWAEARKQHPKGHRAWEQLAGNLSVLNWKKRDTRAEWVQRLKDVFKTFDLRQRCGRWPREIVAYYKLQEGLVELAKPETERLTLEEFAEEVLTSLALLTVPAQPGRGGVELHTPFSIMGAHYAHVFILGAAEGMLPAMLQEDPVLDFYERKQLVQQGMAFEDAAVTARRETLTFYTLLGTATETLTFSYPKLIGKDGSLPSPYLSRLGLEPTSLPLSPIASLEEARQSYLQQGELPEDIVLPRAVHAWTVEGQREKAPLWDEYDGAVGLPLDPSTWVFSASQLTALGHCPFKWFASYILKLRELDEAEIDLSPSLRGRLYHKTLELAFNQMSQEGDVRQQVLERLEAAFRAAEKAISLPVLSAWDARRQEHLAVLRQAIVAEDFLLEGATVLAQEQRFTGQWYGLAVRGIVDRIDATADGLVLLDYKTSSSKPTGAKGADGKATLDVQLPLYMQAAATVLFPERSAKSAYYYSLTKAKTLQQAKVDDVALVALNELADRVKSHLERGDYPVQPDLDEEACKYCSLDLVCRRGSRLKRKGDSA
jgi:RecB family exonuclease